MKIIAVTADVQFHSKPDWLDDFRKRFDKPYHYHITLKQPTTVQDEDVESIKDKLNNLFNNNSLNKQINLRFDELQVEPVPDSGICIMLNSSDKSIRSLQKEIVNSLSEYNNYYKAKYQAYEENFMPHITIGRYLSDEQYAEAAKDLEQDYTCEAYINKIILTVMNNFGPEEANDPNNLTIYNLKS